MFAHTLRIAPPNGSELRIDLPADFPRDQPIQIILLSEEPRDAASVASEVPSRDWLVSWLDQVLSLPRNQTRAALDVRLQRERDSWGE
jgi:hypothetical protein